MLAERALLDAPREVRAHWFEMEIELTRGQALDLNATTCREFDPNIARRVAILKSGRYTIVRPLLLGARAAGRTDLDTAYQAFGEPLGEAFQFRDDLLGAFGSTAETGKPVGDDLREGKPTYLLACAQRRVSGASTRLLRRVGTADLDASAVRSLQQLLDECGAHAEVEERLATLEMQALDALDRMPVDNSVRDRLQALAAAAVWRQS